MSELTDPGDTVAGILIIEDEAPVARDIQSRLKQLGHRVLGLAHNPRQAIELAKETRPDLLLCDIHLKDDIDGIEVARRITRSRSVPVIFLTAYSDRDTVTRAKSIAPYGYVLKPIETPDLQIAIEMALHKFSMEQELNEAATGHRTPVHWRRPGLHRFSSPGECNEPRGVLAIRVEPG